MTYALCGLRVASELPLPELLPWSGEDRPADIEIIIGDVPGRLEDPLHEGPLLRTARDGTCLYTIAGTASYLVEGGRRVTLQPHPGASAPTVRLFLLGSVFGFLCHQRGLLPLHAGCVEIDGKAVAFAGHSGAGKSTLAAAFLRRGYHILADDITVLDMTAPGGPLVLPSFPRIKLWRDALEGMEIPFRDLERIRPELEKYHLPVTAGFRSTALPLRALYHLKTAKDRRHAGEERLRGAMSMEALVDAVYRRMSAFRMGQRDAVMAALLRLMAVPGARLARLMDIGQVDATVMDIVARHGAGAGLPE
ncbi:HPr kinase/phosphorylase [Ferrovibrio sp.]|uniref:HPr kinase/phosphorylase n=1 Tax=Ferrovibrio sp. TaxID=1917215 RepID=UPI003D096DEB